MKKLWVSSLILITLLGVLPSLAAAQEPVEIVFTHIFGVADGSETEDVRIAAIQQIVENFMIENPDIVVTLQSPTTDYTELFNSATLAAQQGTAPHVVQVEEGLTQIAADSGLFVPISDLASDEQLATLDDLIGPVRDYYNLGDTVWSLPWNSSNPVLYINRGMFVEAGLDPDAPPATFAEILTTCEAIMAALPDLGACINWPMSTWFAEQWVAMQNGLLANNNNGRDARATEMLYNSPEMLNVLTWWDQLNEAGYYSYTGSANDFNGEGRAFLFQQTAMTINSTAGITNFVTFGNQLGIDLGVARLPIPNEEATNGVTVGGASVWITAGHSEEELAAANEFVFYLTSTPSEVIWHQGSGYFPNRQVTIDQLTTDGWFDENPFFYVAIDQLLESQRNPATAGAIIGPSTTVRGYLVEAFQAVIDGGVEPAAALESAKERADEALAEYNAAVE